MRTKATDKSQTLNSLSSWGSFAGTSRVLSLLLPCWWFVPVVFAAEELKPAVAGCVGYGITQQGWEKIFNHVLCIVAWKDMEPELGNYEPGFQKIDDFLKKAEARNLHVHLRIRAGQEAPDWLKQKAGTVKMHSIRDDFEREVVKWWEPETGAAYSRLQQALAARYDSHPRAIAVTMTRCMSIWPEPFLHQVNDAKTRDRLIAAGLTTEKDVACQIETFHTHAQFWKQTRSSIAINPYQDVDASMTNRSQSNLLLTARLINEANNILANRLILQNDSMIPSSSELSAEYVKLYDLMKRSGLRFGFQPRDTNSATVKTTRELIETTIAFGGTYLELPGAYLPVRSEQV